MRLNEITKGIRVDGEETPEPHFSPTPVWGISQRAVSPQHQRHLSKTCSIRKLMRIGQLNSLEQPETLHTSKQLLPIKGLHIWWYPESTIHHFEYVLHVK